MKALRVGLIGAGRMGQLHARVYSQLPGVQLIGIVDIDADRAAALAQRCQTQALSHPQEFFGRVQAVSIATPTDTHLEIAAPFLKQGIPSLIEKPLAPSTSQAKQLLSLAEKHKTFIQVGHTERFNPAVRAMERYNFSPRYIEAVRFSPFPFRSMDIGAVFDMMIHDLDLVLHLVAAEPIAIQAIGANILTEHEDLANARLTFADGCVANLSCSRLALATQRTFQVFSDELYISLDLYKKSGFVVNKSQNAERVRQALAKLSNGRLDGPIPNWTELVQTEPLTIDQTEPMRLQLENFINSVNTGAPPMVSGSDGVAAVAVAEAIVQAIEVHHRGG